MSHKVRVIPQKRSMTRGALRNLIDGASYASVRFFTEEIIKDFDKRHLDLNNIDSYLAAIGAGQTLILFNEDSTFDALNDFMIIRRGKLSGDQFMARLLRANNAGKFDKESTFSVPEKYELEEFIKAINPINTVECYNNFEGDTIGALLYNAEGDRIVPEFDEKIFSSTIGLTVEYAGSTEIIKETKTETKQEEKTMTKLTSVIDKNKAALIQAGKIEAGSIVMKRISKLVTPQLPFMVRAYADTPAGRLVMANIFNFAVTQYAGNNKNAVLLADAALQGSMVEMLQSFNFNDLIDKVIEGVDTSKLVSSDNE